MLVTGALDLRIAGPFDGFFGSGLALSFAAQGTGRVGGPLVASLLRMAVALGAAWTAAALGSGGTFPAGSAGIVVDAAAFATGRMVPPPPPTVRSRGEAPGAGCAVPGSVR